MTPPSGMSSATHRRSTSTSSSLSVDSTGCTSVPAAATVSHVGEAIVVPKLAIGKVPPPPESNHRAVHQIRLSALSHNYTCIESAATRQRCSVIVVVKADGYGHGAIESAIHLADCVSADAFAVATLEEGIALRKAFETTPPSCLPYYSSNNAANISTATATSENRSQSSSTNSNTGNNSLMPSRCLRPPQIRILVLGPPVGYPRCFDDYYHHDIEVMCSGPEVANALIEWHVDENERKRTQVERAANDAKQRALQHHQISRDFAVVDNKHNPQDAVTEPASVLLLPSRPEPINNNSSLLSSHATLGNVSGQDLAKEVRAFLINQQAAKATAAASVQKSTDATSTVGTPVDSASSLAANSAATATNTAATAPQVFGGIEALARSSRTREMAAARATAFFREDSGDELDSPATTEKSFPLAKMARKRLRWHALVDSGMGRLGFKTQPMEVGEVGVRRDTVEIIQELVELEVAGAPIEFFGMCTHMADANDKSDYTQAQMNRFKGLLKRVRAAGISIPTVSTDNSAALLTTTLTHFDPKTILAQPHAETRGYVRTGGGIYGQRPAFKQLHAVSTLVASVRHVAMVKEGESVGYDRAYVAPMNVRIATLTIGFADGYPRELGNGNGQVAIRGTLFPVAGNICMDMMMVCLGPASDKTGPGAQVVVGDTAVLWGPLDEDDGDGLVRLQDIAAKLKTTQSALTCGLNRGRVMRKYL